MRLQLKTLFEIKALPTPEKNWKNLLGGGHAIGVLKNSGLEILDGSEPEDHQKWVYVKSEGVENDTTVPESAWGGRK